MVAKIQEPKNQLVITLVTLTILLLAWGLVRPTDALANQITSSSSTWTAPCGIAPDGLACMPEGREGFATTVINNQIIVTHGTKFESCGFACDTNDTRIYNIQKDTWSSGAQAIFPRSELAGATDGHLHYAVGGRNRTNDPDATCPLGNVCADLQVYDPVKDSWTALLPMPTPRAGLAAVIVGHKLYAIGGRTGLEPGDGTALSCVEAYDIASGMYVWSSPNLQEALFVPKGFDGEQHRGHASHYRDLSCREGMPTIHNNCPAE
jgi:N-acetylneuraminic acid mutarotase